MDGYDKEVLRGNYSFSRRIFYIHGNQEILVRIFRKGAIFSAILIFPALCFINTAAASDIILNDLKGSPVNLSSPKNKPTILFFWTTWCPYCRKEIKVLNQNYAQMEKEGITLFAVNIGESSDKVQRFFKDYTLSFGALLDKDGEAADNYDVIGVPTYVFLNKAGRIISHENTLPADYKNLLLK